MHSLSAAVAPPWTCPQCRRRVPGREPLCHCGFERARAAALAASTVPGPPSPAGGGHPPVVLGALLFVGVASVLLYVAVRRLDTVAGCSAYREPPGPRRGDVSAPARPAGREEPAPAGRGGGPRHDARTEAADGGGGGLGPRGRAARPASAQGSGGDEHAGGGLSEVRGRVRRAAGWHRPGPLAMAIGWPR